MIGPVSQRSAGSRRHKLQQDILKSKCGMSGDMVEQGVTPPGEIVQRLIFQIVGGLHGLDEVA